jgi:hypothetical protein
MAYFAKIENNIVVNIIVAPEDHINSLPESETWIKTSSDLTYNKARRGDVYESSANAFYAPQPYDSWTLDTETYQWVCPVDKPQDGDYIWDEETTSWTTE